MQDPDGGAGHRASIARRFPALARSHRARAYIGLGANLGDAPRTLAAAVRSLAALPGVRLQSVSRLYATTPVGVTDQPEFSNAVVALDVPAGPDPATGAIALLVALKQIERAFGRRERRRWAERELDLDLLAFGRARLAVGRPPAGVSLEPGTAGSLLLVPHPEAQRRLFVLAPWSDLAPGLVPPGWAESVASARRRQLVLEGQDAARAVAAWDGAAGWVPLGSGDADGGETSRS